MANACFFSYKGSKPLGGILPYDGMIPYSYANIDKQTPNFSVLGETPMLASNSGKSTTLPFKTVQSSYSYYKHYVYTSPKGKELWAQNENPKIFATIKNVAGSPDVHARSMLFFS